MALGTDFARIAFTSMALISPLCITYKENLIMIFMIMQALESENYY